MPRENKPVEEIMRDQNHENIKQLCDYRNLNVWKRSRMQVTNLKRVKKT